jgi:hypothetical protein
MNVSFGRSDRVDQEKLTALSVELAKHIKNEQSLR